MAPGLSRGVQSASFSCGVSPSPLSAGSAQTPSFFTPSYSKHLRKQTCFSFDLPKSHASTTENTCFGGRECVVKDSLLNSQLGSCLSPSETASDGFLDRRCLAITACPCHGTFRRIPGDAKSLLRTMASSPIQIQPGSGELHRFESCSVNYLIESQD